MRPDLNQLQNDTTAALREKGSKFIGYLFGVMDEAAFEEKLAAIKKDYPDATHHCYAWRVDPTNPREFSQDDGEPAGTAGLPILNQLKSFEVINAGLVVVRYYGGTNLGKSGLIQAYGGTAEMCLQKARLKPIQLIKKVKVIYPYSEQNTIEALIHRFDLTELDAEYTEIVALILGCPVKQFTEFKTQLDQLSHRNIEIELLEESYL